MDGLVIPPLVQWLSPNGAPITIGEEFSIVEVTAGNVTLSSLLFAGITGEQAGTYICVGSIGGITSRAEVNVTIQSKSFICLLSLTYCSAVELFCVSNKDTLMRLSTDNIFVGFMVPFSL